MIVAGFVRGNTACLFIVIVDKIITAFQRIVSLQSDERMNASLSNVTCHEWSLSHEVVCY